MSGQTPKPPLRTLFDSLCSLETREARGEFLDFTCRDHPELRARLEHLLDLRHKAEDFFDFTPPPPPAETDTTADDVGEALEDTGTRIGRYRLLDRLGEGGCGIVYLAEQQEPVKRHVALKIIRLGMDTENVIARFEMERQSLAMMNHPNIARVLDAGATKYGRPYFVMQLVEGEKITSYCDEKRLGIRERLSMFIRICQAVQHAHQKGVIHRDIKPSNILVWENDGEAVPKIIDFGVSKATAVGPGERVSFTTEDQFIGTPCFMSPEQAAGSGVDVDTRADIYSLGATLYELLSGRPPFDAAELAKSGVDEIRRMIREVEPLEPSAALANANSGDLAQVSARRRCEPRNLITQIKGDLDRIVMKAMAKECQHRYSSADALAADIACHLNHEPVSARPPGRLYRFGKLVRRNKGVFVASSLVALSLVLGLYISTALYFRTNQARNAAETARANEAALRHDAEIGRSISHAAVLVKYGNLVQADELLSRIPPDKAKPSLESADTFRTLGLWHAREGRWPQAAKRFAALAYSLTSADKTDSEAISLDFQPAATSLAKAGEWLEYEKLRTMAAERFGDTSSAIIAEQVAKPCLLRPTSHTFLAKLGHLRELMRSAENQPAPTSPAEHNLAAWRDFALALVEYRSGNLNPTLDCLEKCSSQNSENSARQAAALALRAMVLHRQNRTLEAMDDLEVARRDIAARFASQPGIFDQVEPFWEDWINAEILLREADSLMRE